LKCRLTGGGHGDGVLYLKGELSRRGWSQSFLVALPLKLPLGLLLAASVSAVSLLPRLGSGGRGVLLLVPPLVFLALASYSRVNVGVRAVLPVFPFLYLLAAGVGAPGWCRPMPPGVLPPGLGWGRRGAHA